MRQAVLRNKLNQLLTCGSGHKGASAAFRRLLESKVFQVRRAALSSVCVNLTFSMVCGIKGPRFFLAAP